MASSSMYASARGAAVSGAANAGAIGAPVTARPPATAAAAAVVLRKSLLLMDIGPGDEFAVTLSLGPRPCQSIKYGTPTVLSSRSVRCATRGATGGACRSWRRNAVRSLGVDARGWHARNDP